MPVFTHAFRLSVDRPESQSQPSTGSDRFGLQISPNAATESAVVVLQGSINEQDWVDLAEATLRAPMVGAGGTTKSPVVRYVRAVVRTLTGDGAEVVVHVVAK